MRMRPRDASPGLLDAVSSAFLVPTSTRMPSSHTRMRPFPPFLIFFGRAVYQEIVYRSCCTFHFDFGSKGEHVSQPSSFNSRFGKAVDGSPLQYRKHTSLVWRSWQWIPAIGNVLSKSRAYGDRAKVPCLFLCMKELDRIQANSTPTWVNRTSIRTNAQVLESARPRSTDIGKGGLECSVGIAAKR